MIFRPTHSVKTTSYCFVGATLFAHELMSCTSINFINEIMTKRMDEVSLSFVREKNKEASKL